MLDTRVEPRLGPHDVFVLDLVDEYAAKIRRLLGLLAGLAGALAAAGCGKKGRPKPPDPEKSEFPRQYPKPE